MNDVFLYLRRLIFIAFGILCLVISGTQTMAKQPLFDAFKRNIVIDPGHGGQEAGSRGADGTLEKAVVLRLAQIIAAELERDYKVTLTRTGDYQIDIINRAALANHLKADLFLSIHTGGSFLHSTTGTTVYYHNRESNAPTPSVQNSDTQDDNNNSPILWHRVQERHKEKSRALAHILSRRLSNLNHSLLKHFWPVSKKEIC